MSSNSTSETLREGDSYYRSNTDSTSSKVQLGSNTKRETQNISKHATSKNTVSNREEHKEAVLEALVGVPSFLIKTYDIVNVIQHLIYYYRIQPLIISSAGMSPGSLLSLNNPMNLLREYSLGTSNTIISHHSWDNSICMTSTKLGIILMSSASFMSPLKEIKSKFLSTHLWYKSKWIKKLSQFKIFFHDLIDSLRNENEVSLWN